VTWARTAALLAFASAAVSGFWLVGGTALLDTVGGQIDDLARERSAGAVLVLAVHRMAASWFSPGRWCSWP
jgi:hypothetical protein